MLDVMAGTSALHVGLDAGVAALDPRALQQLDADDPWPVAVTSDGLLAVRPLARRGHSRMAFCPPAKTIPNVQKSSVTSIKRFDSCGIAMATSCARKAGEGR